MIYHLEFVQIRLHWCSGARFLYYALQLQSSIYYDAEQLRYYLN